MSCYFRHMKDILDEAGIEVTKENKRRIDSAIHGIVAVEYKDCSATWKAIKRDVLSDEAERARFVEKLKATLN